MKRGLASAWSVGNAMGAWLLSGGLALAQAPPATPLSAPSTSSAISAPHAAITANDIRDIRGPLPIPSPWTWPLLGVGIALAAAGVYAVWRIGRHASAAAALRPADIALRRLLAARRLMESGACRNFSIEISDAVRAYIEAEFGAQATHLTTEEFLHDQLASANARLVAHKGLLEEFLMQCDVAKFAGWQLAPAAMEALYVNARRFVQDTAAVPETPAPPPPNTDVPAHHKEPYVSLPST